MGNKVSSLKVLFTKQTALILVGYSLYKTVAFNSYVTSFSTSRDTLGYISGIPFLFATSAGIFITSAVIFLYARSRHAKQWGIKPEIPLAVLGCGYIFAFVSGYLPDTSIMATVLGLVWGCTTAILGVIWVELLVCEQSPIVLILQLAFASFASAVLSVLLGYLPEYLSMVFSILMLIVSGWATRSARSISEPIIVSDEKASFAGALKDSSSPLVAYFLFELVVGLVNMYAFAGSSSFTISTMAPVEGKLICAILVCIIVFFTNKTPNPTVIYLFVFPSIISIFLLLPFFGEVLGKPMSTVIYAAYIFTSMLSSFCYILAIRNNRANVYAISALVQAAVRIALVIGLSLGYRFAGLEEGGTFVHLSIVAVVSVYFLGLVVLFWSYRNSKSKQVVVQVSGDFEQAVAKRADEFVKQYHLTNRERDVLIGLARGNTASGIAQQLFISTSTAQGYIKSLYTKLGVNKKQQVMDLFDFSNKDS